jgi:hypothetical protein
VAYPGIFFLEGVQQIQLRTQGRENRDLGAVAPYSGVLPNFKTTENRILISFIFHGTGNSVQLYPNFGISGGED